MFSSTQRLPPPPPMEPAELQRLIRECPLLPVGREADSALLESINCADKTTAEIAAALGENRSLAFRILRTVNSAFYGLSQQVEDVEEAILYLGMGQVRRLVLTAPLVDSPGEFEKRIAPQHMRSLWRHGMATAILVQEFHRIRPIHLDDPTQYMAGLLHDVGRLVMAVASPKRFDYLIGQSFATTEELLKTEVDLFGCDHAEIGALYLERLPVPPEAVEAVRLHHAPEGTSSAAQLAASIQICEEFARKAGIDSLPSVRPLSEAGTHDLAAWIVLYGSPEKAERTVSARLRRSLPHLPKFLGVL